MRGAAVLAALAMVAVPARAQNPSEGRIWKGQLGEQAITACFFEERPGTGIFYTDAALEPVRLETESETAPDRLREMQGYDDPSGPVWTLTFAEDRITGVWRNGADTRPIRLAAHAVSRPEYGSACESGAFLDPVLAGGAVKTSRETLDGTAYTVFAYTGPQRSGLVNYGAQAFALDPLRRGDEAINRALAAEIPDGTAAHEAGQCLAGSLSWSSGLGDYGKFLQPTLITSRWLGVSATGSSWCGGAHPNHFITARVYDRDSGARVDPAAWFTPGALTFYDWEPGPGEIRPIAGLSEALTEALLAHWPADDDRAECRDAARGPFSWNIGVTRDGLLFIPQFPHVIFACTEEFVLPWAEAEAFLSPEGRAVMESLR